MIRVNIITQTAYIWLWVFFVLKALKVQSVVFGLLSGFHLIRISDALSG